MKSTIDDLQILRIEEDEKKAGLPDDDEIHTIAKLVEKAKEENSFVVVNPTTVEFPYIQPNIVAVERGPDVNENETDTIVRHHRRRVIQAVIGYLLLVGLILLIAFAARNSISDKDDNK